jgi:succinyl-diaminopimelate desuccinylase
VRQRGAEAARLCADLIRIPSENPPGDTTRLAAAGAAGHVAYGQGESAIEKMRAVLDAIAGLHGRRGRPAAPIAALMRRQRPLVERHWGRGTGALADRLTVNIGTVRGGGQVNLIPAACEAEVASILFT